MAIDATQRFTNFKKSFETAFSSSFTEVTIFFQGTDLDTTQYTEWLEVNYTHHTREDQGYGGSSGSRYNDNMLFIDLNLFVKIEGGQYATQADRPWQISDLIVDALNNTRIALKDYETDESTATWIRMLEPEITNLGINREDGLHGINHRIVAQWSSIQN